MQMSRQQRRAAERKARKAEIKAQAQTATAPAANGQAESASLDELTDLRNRVAIAMENQDFDTLEALIDRYEAAQDPAEREYDALMQRNVAEQQAAEREKAEARAARNRANAVHSTGPRSAQGKAASSENSLQHGLYSKRRFLPGENPVHWQHLVEAFMREHAPVNQTEGLLVEELAEHHWRILRYRRIEENILCADNCSIPRITAAQRFLSSAERSFYRALKALRDLQKARGFVPHQTFAQASAKANSAGMAQPPSVSGGRAVRTGFDSTKTSEQPMTQPATASRNGSPQHGKHFEEAA